MTLNLIDLFSGAGGLTEGFLNHDEFNILGHVEKDYSASLTLKVREAFHYLKKNNKLNIYRDYLNNNIDLKTLFSYVPESIIDKVLNEEISQYTLSKIFKELDQKIQGRKVHGIIGGPPCQAYSTIGRAINIKKKETDERIYLYKFYIKFLRKYSPDFFIFENVKGLLSFKDTHNKLLLFLHTILQHLLLTLDSYLQYFWIQDMTTHYYYLQQTMLHPYLLVYWQDNNSTQHP